MLAFSLLILICWTNNVTQRTGLHEPMNTKQGRLSFITRFTCVTLGIFGLGLQVSAQTVELQEVLSFGDFYDIGDIETTEDGSILISDVKNFTVFKYDAGGRLLRRSGRSGRGPGEFAGGPNHIALVDGDVLVSDLRAFAVHRFDANLNYISSLRPLAPMTMDTGSDGRIYIGIPDILSDQYVTVYGSDGVEISKLSIDHLSGHNLENRFWLLAGQEDRIILVFAALNRIDIRDTKGRLLRQLSIAGLPHKYPGALLDLPELSGEVSERVAKARRAARYVPGGLVFTMAVLDYRGHIFLEGGGEVGKLPVSRTVYVVDLFGEVKAVFSLPPHLKLAHVDREGHLYAIEELKEGSKVRKYKMVYRDF